MTDFIFRISGEGYDYNLTIQAVDRFEAFKEAVDYCKKHPTEKVESIILNEIKDPYIAELKEKLYRICDETKTSRSGMDYLVNYYMTNLGWNEADAINYAIKLFHNGTIQQIKLINKDGEEL